MKETFSNKYINWLFLIVTVVILADRCMMLFQEFEFITSAVMRIIFFLSAFVALLSNFIKNFDSEKFARIFVLCNFILPPLFIIGQIASHYFFYSSLRTDLMDDIPIYINLIVGIMLFGLTIKFSKKSAEERGKEYSLFILYLGSFLVIWNFIKVLEYEPSVSIIMKIIIKTIFGLTLIYIGIKLMKKQLSLAKTVIISALLLFINISF